MEPTWAGSLPERLYKAEVRELALPGTVAGSRCGGSGPGIRGWGARRWGGVRPGLDGGAVSRSPAVTALLVLLKQLLQGICVEHVIVVHLLLGGLRALGHQDGAAHCRDRGTQVREGFSAAHIAHTGLLPCSQALTHSSDESGQGHQALGLGCEVTVAPEDARRKVHELLEGGLEQMLPGVWGRGLNCEGFILSKGVHGHQRDTGKRGAREKRTSGALGAPPDYSPRVTTSQVHLRQMRVLLR